MSTTVPIRSKTPTPQPPTITPLPARAFTKMDLRPLQDDFKLYQRIELAVGTDGQAGNPFDPAQVDLSVRFTSPSGKSVTIPAFWYQDYDPKTLNPLGQSGWRARFTPNEPGSWTAQALLTLPAALKSAPLTLAVGANPGAHGFVRVDPKDPRYLAFDDGSFYFPIGLNMGWATSDTLADYAKWLDHLSQNGGNYIRVWMASWSFALEWDDTGLGNYSNRLQRAWLLDQVFKLAEERGVYVMLCVLNHGAFSATTNPEWPANPYNAKLGGPLESPQEFVTNPIAKDLFKRRVRYIAARWTYSPNLAVWEWWNEVNWTPIYDTDLKPWIAEMTSELRKYDPYHHLVSTSWSTGPGNRIWGMKELDLAQEHDYSAIDPLKLMPVHRQDFQNVAKNKPVLLGEYGSSANGDGDPYSRGATHLHNGLWAAPFAGYAGTGMYWWWDNYIEPLNLWYQYRGVADFFQGEDLRGLDPASLEVRPSGARALALRSRTRALVWVRSNASTIQAAKQAYDDLTAKGTVAEDWIYTPPALTGLTLLLPDLENGEYTVTWYSTIKGQVGESTQVKVTDETLTLEVPEMLEDWAVKVIKK